VQLASNMFDMKSKSKDVLAGWSLAVGGSGVSSPT